MEHLRQHGSITRREVEKLLGIGQTAAGKILKEMVNKKLVKPAGAGRNRRYDSTVAPKVEDGLERPFFSCQNSTAVCFICQMI